MNDDDIDFKKKKGPVDEPFPWLDWHPIQLWESRSRLELIGDSKLVVNWVNGIWPIKNKWHLPLMVENIGRLHNLFDDQVQPRHTRSIDTGKVWADCEGEELCRA